MAQADSDLWTRVSPYLDHALELEPSELEPWLAALDNAHPELARELRELLALHAANRASGFMERAPLGPDDCLVARALTAEGKDAEARFCRAGGNATSRAHPREGSSGHSRGAGAESGRAGAAELAGIQ